MGREGFISGVVGVPRSPLPREADRRLASVPREQQVGIPRVPAPEGAILLGQPCQPDASTTRERQNPVAAKGGSVACG